MIINLFDLEKKFSLKIPKAINGYYSSGARDEVTLKRNREIFNNYELLPKLLRDVSNINTSTKLMEINVDSPILLAPVAMQQMAHEDGELATAKAAKNFNTIMTHSTISNYSVQDVGPVYNK